VYLTFRFGGRCGGQMLVEGSVAEILDTELDVSHMQVRVRCMCVRDHAGAESNRALLSNAMGRGAAPLITRTQCRGRGG